MIASMTGFGSSKHIQKETEIYCDIKSVNHRFLDVSIKPNDIGNEFDVYTQSKIISENIKWNLNQNSKRIYSLIVNTRNANAFTGKQGYESMKKLSKSISSELTKKQEQDEDSPKIISSKDIIP